MSIKLVKTHKHYMKKNRIKYNKTNSMNIMVDQTTTFIQIKGQRPHHLKQLHSVLRLKITFPN